MELSKAVSIAAARLKQAAAEPKLLAKRPAAANITPSNPEAAKKKKPVYSLKGEIIRLVSTCPMLAAGVDVWIATTP